MTMTNITAEAAVEALLQAFEWEPFELSKLFDQIVCCLHRNPRFAGLTLTELDLLLADTRCKVEDDVDEIEDRLIEAFKDALFDVGEGERGQ
jgi:hypothetical protein